MIDRAAWPWLDGVDAWIATHPEGPTGYVPPWHSRRVAARRLQRDLRETESGSQHHDLRVSSGHDRGQRARVPESDERPQM